MELTADTITDEQIRELRSSAVERNRWYAATKTLDEVRETIAICDSALNPDCHAERKTEARARCAEILNARAKETK